LSSNPEVLVIGGGPAGLAAAISASQAGLSVTVAEPLGEPIDKCCGEGLLPGAVRALESLGIPRARLLTEGQRLRGIRFFHGSQCATADFSSLALGVRRTTLHALLQEIAASLGVERIAASARLVSVGERCAVQVGEQTLRPRWVVGADGSQSAVRHAAGLAARHVTSRRFALRQHFELHPAAAQSAFVEVYWAKWIQAYVTPVGERSVGVAVLSTAKPGSLASALEHLPALRARLESATVLSTVRGAVTLHQTLRRTVSGSIALVGDAAGSVDAITGDGLSLAFSSALALGSALVQNQLDSYQAAHRRLHSLPRIMSSTLLGMGAHPVVTTAAMALLGHVPYLFPTLLRLHTGVHPTAFQSSSEDASWQTVPTSTRSAT
jgi:flavin-dependent dehydrogenase